MTPPADEIDLAFKARVLRTMMRHKVELGLGSDEQVLVAYPALISVPHIRRRIAQAVHADGDRLDG